MLSLIELERAVEALRLARAGARLDKCTMPAADELVLELSGGGDRRRGDKLRVLLSCRQGFARLSSLEVAKKALDRPPAFGQYLRAHLQGSRFLGADLRGDDRQAVLHFEGKEGRLDLLLSIMGARSNLYLLDQSGLLLAAARPLADTRRDLSLGDPWIDPEPRGKKPAEDRFADVATPDLLAAIERQYALAESSEHDDRERRRITRALGRARAGIEKKIRRLDEDLAAAARASEYEQKGELLKASLGSVAKKATETVAVHFETGEEVRIALDPKKSPTQNMEEYFRRARKAQRKGEKASVERGDKQARLEEMDALIAELEACASADEIAAFAERPEVARLVGRYAPERAETGSAAAPRKVWKLGKRELPTRLVPKRYAGTAGLEIWVGKNDEGNDILTTRLARGRDLFFHLEGNPGSHVVLRVEGPGDPPHEALIDAAELSVHFSKARNSSKASVHVAHIKDVSKPAGAKPGLVYVHRGRTIQLRRSPERMKRLLESRIEE